jgi:type VI secretion system protein ImpA
MASESVIDVESLCAPISDSQPAGPFWRDDEECSKTLYPDVESAWREAKRNQRKQREKAYFADDAPQQRNYPDPDWNLVIQKGEKLLLKSKDLWVGCWMVEALSRVHGFAGLRDGIRLISGLCKQYWESIYPRPDELDGIRNTLAQFDSDVFAELVLLMPITQSGRSTADYDMSTEMESLDEKDQDVYRKQGVVSTVEFESQIRDSDPEFLVNLIQDATAASAEFDALIEFLDEKCGMDAPASSKVAENFEQSLALIQELAGSYLPKQTSEEAQGGAAEEDSTPLGQSSHGTATDSGWDRQLAFQQVRKIADEFEKFEPNSPVAPVLRHAVRLGELTWRELIEGLLSEDDPENRVLRQILKQTGFQQSPDSSSNEN